MRKKGGEYLKGKHHPCFGKFGKHHPSSTHGMSGHPLYMRLAQIRYKCTTSKHPDHANKKGQWRFESVMSAFRYILPMYEQAKTEYPRETISIDRIDCTKGYEYGNIQCIPDWMNSKKRMEEMPHNKPMKGRFGKDHPTVSPDPVAMILHNGEKRLFLHASEAERITSICRKGIRRSCKGLQNTAGGHRWCFV